jgi:hypothetical protein
VAVRWSANGWVSEWAWATARAVRFFVFGGWRLGCLSPDRASVICAIRVVDETVVTGFTDHTSNFTSLTYSPERSSRVIRDDAQ